MTQVDDYCDYLIRTGRKRSTVKTYRSQLRMCIELLTRGGLPTEAEKISEESIYYLIRTLDMTEPSARSYLMVLNGMIEHYTGVALVRKMRILWNRPIRNRVFITTDDFIRLFSIANDREKVVLVLGAFMGLRREEMQHITLSDIRRDRIIIHGKGHGKNGLVCEQPMPIEVKEIIDRYLRWRSSLTGEDRSEGRLIVYYDKKRNVIDHYCDGCGALSDMIRDLGKRAGVEVTCHSLRRLFCTNLYYGVDGEGGCDLATVKDLMRHASINTTLQCYIDVKDQEREKAMRNFGMRFGQVINKHNCITKMQSDRVGRVGD
jgi:integrase